MIKSFKCKETEKIYQRQFSRKFPNEIQRTAMRKLWMIDASPDLISLRVPPSNRFKLLKGDRKGQYSIRINMKWRICFKWKSGDAFEVEIVDYH
jgi:proteic killer suppression protein